MQIKPYISRTLLLGSVSFFSVFLAATSSYAGFQWVAPAPATESWEAPPMTSRPPSSPSLPKDMAFETQVIQAPVATQNLLPPPGALSKAAPEMGDMVLGFADNVPLTIALRQILPKDVDFSVAPDVSMGKMVSWQGGAPWRTVLSDMLKESGLEFKEEGGKVRVLAATAASGPALTDDLTAKSSPKSFDAPMQDSGPVNLLARPSESRQDRPSALGGRFLVPPQGVSQAVSEVGTASVSASSGMDMVDTWSGKKGETLRDVLRKWTQRAGVDLSWQTEYDYPLQADVSLRGGFEEVVRGVLMGFQNAEPQPYGDLHKNQLAGQNVLVVRARGNKNAN